MTEDRQLSPQTVARYKREAERLRRRYVREKGQEPEVDWPAFLDWLDAVFATVAPSTRRQYRAALANHQKLHHPDCPPRPIPKNLPNRKTTRKEQGRRGPANKAKSIPESVERAVLLALENAVDSDSGAISYSDWAECLFRAGLRFGLRPCEWRRARFTYMDDGQLALQVVNGKQGHGRGLGSTRTLIIDETRIEEVDPKALEAADWLVAHAHPLSESEYESVRILAGQQMRRILKGCGKPCRTRAGSVTLYTARHQFAANAKSDGLTREEIAALMGHASIYTAGEHYGRRRHGRGRLGRPSSPNSHARTRREAVTVVSPTSEDLYLLWRIQRWRQGRRNELEARVRQLMA